MRIWMLLEGGANQFDQIARVLGGREEVVERVRRGTLR